MTKVEIAALAVVGFVIILMLGHTVIASGHRQQGRHALAMLEALSVVARDSTFWADPYANNGFQVYVSKAKNAVSEFCGGPAPTNADEACARLTEAANAYIDLWIAGESGTGKTQADRQAAFRHAQDATRAAAQALP